VGRNVFIHHNGALGDILLSLPAIRALRGPHDQIHLACREDIANFLSDFGFVSAGLRSDDRLFLPLFTDEDVHSVKEFLSRFDIIYVFTPSENTNFATGMRSLFPGTQFIRTLPPAGLRMHVADYRSVQVDPIGEDSSQPLLAVPPNLREMAEAILRSGGYDYKRPLVAVHPGSGARKKCWPMERFSKVMRRLGNRIDCFFVIFSGPAEDRELRREIERCAEVVKNSCFHVADSGLATVASLLSLCDLYVGNDSGITHLASCVMSGGIIALFGPTDPGLWAPKTDRCTVIKSDRECSPCFGVASMNGSRGFPAQCGVECISDIAVDRVLNEMMRALQIFVA
jgi:ADP-heptose:LPS heptosyltransferase